LKSQAINHLLLDNNLKNLIMSNIRDELLSQSLTNDISKNRELERRRVKIETLSQFLKDMRENPIFDFDEFKKYSELNNRYIILHTPRSGSTAICDELTQLGLFGKPDEYLNDYHDVPKTISNFPSTDLANFIEYILRFTQSGNGVAGLKCDYHSLDIVANACSSIIPYFKKCNVIQLFRKDKIGQSISLFKAQEENIFHDYGGTKQSDVMLDEKKLGGILRIHCDLVYQEAMFSCFLRDNKIKSKRLSYELFCEDKLKFYKLFGDYLKVETSMTKVQSLKSNLKILRNKNTEEIKKVYIEYLNQLGLMDYCYD
jgi:LPS sulfotransferase NodH